MKYTILNDNHRISLLKERLGQFEMQHYRSKIDLETAQLLPKSASARDELIEAAQLALEIADKSHTYLKKEIEALESSDE